MFLRMKWIWDLVCFSCQSCKQPPNAVKRMGTDSFWGLSKMSTALNYDENLFQLLELENLELLWMSSTVSYRPVALYYHLRMDSQHDCLKVLVKMWILQIYISKMGRVVWTSSAKVFFVNTAILTVFKAVHSCQSGGKLVTAVKTFSSL